ncbi:MAG: transglutaminase family protein [Puniceicoccaceae bacterium]|nr:MAG: transglutaminase family protein [Puniceicoccaceae bacterium]
MRFSIVHKTSYRYAMPAYESFMEVRLTPLTNRTQRLIQRHLRIEPDTGTARYLDYFGNAVEHFSVIRRHSSLSLTAVSEVETFPAEVSPEAVDISLSEARQIFNRRTIDLFEYLMPSAAIALSRPIRRQAALLLHPGDQLGEALQRLLAWFRENFTYEAGSTSIDTPVHEVLETRRGVCQDFAHLFIALLRSSGIPARYVCGYIETEAERRASEGTAPRLVGASESHAWVEVALPGGEWYPLDPTNHCLAGERHVMVACGRDYHDTTPTRGVFKGAVSQRLDVSVKMRRKAVPLRGTGPAERDHPAAPSQSGR